MSALFRPFDLGPVRLANRIVVSPMCQYPPMMARRPTGTSSICPITA
jgi:2,4-dienoyl-CoA reductase-like NADH-dependent reductase (Old Yellow Enzyme family)